MLALLKRIKNEFIRNSCVTGNKSPRASRAYSKASTLPFQQKLSPAELKYESYVQATVAANAKSPVELVEQTTTTATTTTTTQTTEFTNEHASVTATATAPPPPPPPRRHASKASSMASPTDGAEHAPTPSSERTILSPGSQASVAEFTGTSDAQTLYNIRQQMALSLKRMKDLEEQVRTIPELQSELSQLRSERVSLQQSLQRKEEELQRARETARLSATPSPIANSKNASPVQFTPQRISPISLDSLGSRLRTNSNSSERQLKMSLKRDVGTMCGLHTTRDIAVGSPVLALRSVGTSPAQLLKISELLYTQLEMEQHIQTAISSYEEQRTLQRLKKLISVGTQMYVPKSEQRDSGMQTMAEKSVLTYTIGVLAKPATRESFVTCKPSVRTVASSEDRITDVLCEKCAVARRTVACSTDDAVVEQSGKALSLKLLDMPGRSHTFSLGENETLQLKRKTIGTQYTPLTVQNVGSQTSLAVVHTVGVQFTPETLSKGVQSYVDCASRQTDTQDLIRLCATQTSTEEIAAPTPTTPPMPAIVTPPPLPAAPAKALRSTGSNTDAPKTTEYGMNTEPPKTREYAMNTEPAQTIEFGVNTESPKLIEYGVNTEVKTTEFGINTEPPEPSAKELAAKPVTSTRHFASNTEQVHKRDIACGDVVKPHISIACADNYCDSCKDAIKNLAKDFSKVLASPVPTRAVDSKIPRPKHLASPSPARRQFKRQNTYTITPSPTPSPVTEKKSLSSSLQEKPPAISSFQTHEFSGETQCFISESTTEQQQQQQSKTTTAATTRRPSNAEELAAVFSQQPTSSFELGEGDLIVKQEKRVSISWSRDASPVPPTQQRKDNSPLKSLESSFSEQLHDSIESTESKEAPTPAADIDVSKGARKKTSPIKSSQAVEIEKSQATELEQKPPTKAMLHKLAMVEAEPRQKISPSKEMLSALKIINGSLKKKLGAKPFSSSSLRVAKSTIQGEWFRISGTDQANPHEVEDYLDCFEELSVPMLEYCVNMVDKNGNTAMHYAVSHGNFDVVSILLDSKVCNVNQMNNAGYTCVMLVSLAKLKSAAHRTVVERLFQMADVNIRAKKHCQTALMLAVSHGNSDMVEMLINAGADINIQDEDGSTALMCAAEHGRIDIVKHLLSQGDCDSLKEDVDGSTAFKIAWQAGHRDIGLLLYVHEQMLRSKLPNRGEPLPLSISPRLHKGKPPQ